MFKSWPPRPATRRRPGGQRPASPPVIAVVGAREAEGRMLALRRLGSNGQEIVSLADAVKNLGHEALPPDLKRAADTQR